VTRAVHAEWTKLRSVRSTSWSLAGIVALTLAVGVISCATSHTEGGYPGAPGDEDVVLISLAGILLGQVAAVVLGAFAIGTEYGTGTIRATFAAMPRRRRVVVAKIAVVGAAVFVAGLVACLASFYLGQLILHGNGFVYENGYPAASLSDAPTLRAVVAGAVYTAGVALLGLGAATITRSTAAAISGVLGLLLVPFVLVGTGILPESLSDVLEKGTPMAGINAIVTVENTPLDPWPALGVLGAWVAGALMLALWLVRTRDA
jgi:ABC-2 type transport system permease protein